MTGERSGDVDGSIKPISWIILHHRFTVQRHNAPYKCGNTSGEPSPFLYFESTSFLQLFIFHCQRQELNNLMNLCMWYFVEC